MDKVVQQNASAVQQSAAAAEGMRQQAEALVRAVGTFRLASGADAVRLGAPGQARAEPAAPPALAPARSGPPARATQRAKQPVAAGDDWEEF
jgi:hypothetical protein